MAFEGLSEKLSNAFKKLRSKGRLTEEDVKAAMREIRLALLEADVSYKVVKDFVKQVSARAVGTEVLESLTPAQMIVKIVNEELCTLMGSENQKLQMASQPPTVVMLVGLQGAGKTTMCGKLGNMIKKGDKKPLLVACDVYSPAAIDQLQASCIVSGSMKMFVRHLLMLMVVIGAVLTVDVHMGVGMCVLVGVGHAVMAVSMGMLVDVLMVMLQGDGVFDHQHRGYDHNRQARKELNAHPLSRQKEAEGHPQEGGDGIVGAGFGGTQILLRLDIKIDTQAVCHKT